MHQQHAMQKIVRQMLNRGRALAFGTWFAHVQETRGVRVMVKRQWHRTIAFCLDEWREFTTDEVSKARVMDRIVTRFQRLGCPSAHRDKPRRLTECRASLRFLLPRSIPPPPCLVPEEEQPLDKDLSPEMPSINCLTLYPKSAPDGLPFQAKLPPFIHKTALLDHATP